MKTSLVIMAAGIGSRFGGGIKQLAPVGPNGEIIMDYSIHDALEAGFDRVVFIIRRDLEKDFREVIGERIEKVCPVAYAFQEKEDLPAGFTCPASASWHPRMQAKSSRVDTEHSAQLRIPSSLQSGSGKITTSACSFFSTFTH